MKKIFLTMLLALISVAGAWAKDYTGSVLMDFGFNPKVGDRIALNCQLQKRNSSKVYIAFTEDKISGSGFTTGRRSSWTPSSCLSEGVYADYAALNPNAAQTDYLIITGVNEDVSNGETIYRLTGHFSGFYTQTEMADGLQAAYNAAKNKGITNSQLNTYKNNIKNASSAAAARTIYDEALNLLTLADTKVEANDEITALMASETNEDLRATAQSYKERINSATSINDIAAYLAEFKTLVEEIKNAERDIQDQYSSVTDSNLRATINSYISRIYAATSTTQVQGLKTELYALYQAMLNAITEIDTELGDITDEPLVAQVGGYKNQIYAAVTIDAIAPIKTNALNAIADYKAEQERLRLLAEAKQAAIAEIQALVSGSTDALAISQAEKYTAEMETVAVIEEVAPLLNKAKEIINNLLTEPTSLAFTFTGEGMPIETQHGLEGVEMTFSEDGEQMTVSVNGSSATYDLNKVGELSHFRGTPSISLHANQDPDSYTPSFYTTFYSGLEAYELPEGVKAYTAKMEDSGNETVVRLTTVTGNILPQGEAVLLYTTEGNNITMNVADGNGVDKADVNMFRGVDVATQQASTNNYMLSYGQKGLGFYLMNSSTLLAANKAFLTQPANYAKAMRMVFDDGTTGIEAINDNDNDYIYSVSGIRLNQLQKGINIVGGKKIVVK